MTVSFMRAHLNVFYGIPKLLYGDVEDANARQRKVLGSNFYPHRANSFMVSSLVHLIHDCSFKCGFFTYKLLDGEVGV